MQELESDERNLQKPVMVRSSEETPKKKLAWLTDGATYYDGRIKGKLPVQSVYRYVACV